MAEAGVFRFFLLAFSSLFSIINPISAAPLFVAMTDGRSAAERRRTALHACLTAAGVLAVFAAAGGAIFVFFGITVPAFQIAGGILFAFMGIRTLLVGKEEEPQDEEERADPSVVPLGIPLIAGPGAISTVMVLVGQAADGRYRVALASALVINIVLTFLILLVAPAIVPWIGKTGQKIVTKIMGLMSAVIGVQFVLNGATTVAVEILKTVKG